MKRDKNKWFGAGSNLRGHNQILSRLDYLEVERENISSSDVEYEFFVIKNLIDLEPNQSSKEFYWNMVKGYTK